MTDDSAAFQALERARALAKNPAARRRKVTKRREDPMPTAGPGLGNPGSGAHPSRRDPQIFGRVMESLINARGWTDELESGAVVGLWPEIVGADIASHTEILSFEDRVLVVRASSTAWATNLKLLMGSIRTRIAEVVGPEAVTEITILGPAAPSWKKGPRSVKGRGPRDTYG